jgi:chromosome segregation ATPase
MFGLDPSASLVEQLHGLYADREQLESALGTSDPRVLVQRVRSLEGQLQAVTANLSALGRALGAADLSEFVLRTEATIQNLTEQLHDVYAEREQAPAMTDSLVAQLHDLYAAREVEGAATASLVAQLEALYAEREASGVTSPVYVAPAPSAAHEATIASLVAQLEALYADRERDEDRGRGAVVDRAGGVSSARERAEVAGLQASVDSLTNQLASLYRDRELLEHAFGSASAEDIALRVLDREDSFVAQLEALYGDRDGGGVMPPPRTALDEIRARFVGR